MTEGNRWKEGMFSEWCDIDLRVVDFICKTETRMVWVLLTQKYYLQITQRNCGTPLEPRGVREWSDDSGRYDAYYDRCSMFWPRGL